MNCQEEQMTQEMWDAMPEGMTVNYVRQMEQMTPRVAPTVSVMNGSSHQWDAEVGAWYATRITNMDELLWAYAVRTDGGDAWVATETERVYA
jgi:hypothetical protein